MDLTGKRMSDRNGHLDGCGPELLLSGQQRYLSESWEIIAHLLHASIFPGLLALDLHSARSVSEELFDPDLIQAHVCILSN